MRTKHAQTNRYLIIAAALAIGCGAARAQAPVAVAVAEKPKWEGSVNAGLTLTSGNSDSVLFTVGGKATKKWDQNEFLLGAVAGYGKSDDVNNNEFAQGYAQYNHLFTERFYGGLRLDASYDGIADLAYRITLTPLAGYYFIKTTNTTLSAEVGPSLVTEKYFNQNPNTYCGIRFGEKFDHQLTETTKVWEYASYTPQVDRWTEKYIINVELGISADINKAWGLRVVAQYIYDSEPAPGRERGDFRLIAGTQYKF